MRRLHNLLSRNPWKAPQTISARFKSAEAIPPEPLVTRFGLMGIAVTVTTGLLIGAAFSKSMANFLEENDLFVPSDDDDDDD